MKLLKNSFGYTVTEVLIAMLMTGIVSMAGFQFYIKMHNQTLNQENISEMQQNSRASLQEIIGSLRIAGYKIDGHAPFAINGDSLYVFSSITQPVDTILYYLVPYTIGEYSLLESMPRELHPHKLMRKVNSQTPEIFSDYINEIQFNAINASTVEVIIKVQPQRPDLDYAENEGLRLYTATETVIIRTFVP